MKQLISKPPNRPQPGNAAPRLSDQRFAVQQNPALHLALALLAHPLSVAALALLLINDHLLRRFWPSWVTGKLGDITWLFVAPLALAALLAGISGLVYRTRSPRARQLALQLPFLAAYALVGLVFILVKTLPAVHAVVTRTLAEILGAAPALVRDPSDLLTLPALAASAWFWKTRPPVLLPERTARGLVALPLAALLTLANAGMPDPGVECFQLADGAVYARAGYAAYRSQDGGLNWTFEPNFQSSCPYVEGTDQWREITNLPADSSIRYRYQSNQSIETSRDGGQNWETAYTLEQVSEAEQFYYTRSRPGNTVFRSGPLDAIHDPASGNVLFAMGHQGVLVHAANGDWVWSMSGQYQRAATFPTLDAFGLLLGGVVPLAVVGLLLVFATLALRWTLRPLRTVAVVIAWLAFLMVSLLFPPPTSNGYTQTATYLGILGAAVVALSLSIEQTFRLRRRAPRALPRLALIALIAALLFFLPYVLWLYNALPSITVTSVFAVILLVAVLAAGWVMLRRRAF